MQFPVLEEPNVTTATISKYMKIFKGQTLEHLEAMTPSEAFTMQQNHFLSFSRFQWGSPPNLTRCLGFLPLLHIGLNF